MLSMIWLSGPALLLLVALSVSSEEDQATIVLLYKKETLTPARGSSVPLSCKVHYNYEVCGMLRVVWIQDREELTDPSKYFTTVTEELAGGDMRNRKVVTEILDLNKGDSGSYQCSAECENTETAVGHNIDVIVKG